MKERFWCKGIEAKFKRKSVQVAEDALALIWDTQPAPESLSSSTCRMWVTSSSWPWREVCEEKGPFQVWFQIPKPLLRRGAIYSKDPKGWHSPSPLSMSFWQRNVSLRLSSLSRSCFILLNTYTLACFTSFSSPSCFHEHTLCARTCEHTQLYSQGFLVLAPDQRLSVFPYLEPIFMTGNAGGFSAHIKNQTKYTELKKSKSCSVM